MNRQERYGCYVSDHLVRRVWAVLTNEPQITVRDLAGRLGCRTWAGVAIALKVLRDAGYIEFEKGTERARTIVVPFIELKRNR